KGLRSRLRPAGPPEKSAPTSTAAALLLAESLADRGRFDEALPLFDAARAAPALRFRAGGGRAAALLALDRRDEAAAELRGVFQAYTSADEGELGAPELRAMARAALTAEQIPALAREHVRSFATDARDLFQRSFERDPDQPDLLVDWARVYLDKWD